MAAKLPFTINREALPVLVYLLYLSSKLLRSLRTEKAESNQYGFESRTAGVNPKENMNEETSAKGKER